MTRQVLSLVTSAGRMGDGVLDERSVTHHGVAVPEVFGKKVTRLSGLLHHVVSSLEGAHYAVDAVYGKFQLGGDLIDRKPCRFFIQQFNDRSARSSPAVVFLFSGRHRVLKYKL